MRVVIIVRKMNNLLTWLQCKFLFLSPFSRSGWGDQIMPYLQPIDVMSCTWHISQHFFSWTQVLKHNKNVEIKLFSKVDIKENNISTVILLIKFLIYQWDPPHLQGSGIVYIFVYITKSVFYLISNLIFVYINH